MSESDKSGKPELTTIPIVVYDPKPEAKALLQTNEPMIVVCGLLNQLRAARQTTQIESEFAQARIAELETLISDMFDWCKCGYVHNSRMPVDRGLTILAKAKSIRDKKEVTPQDIRDWLH